MILRKTQGSKLTVNNEKKSINLDSRNPISFSFLNTKGIMIILQKHINPKPVSSKYLEHGKKFKPIALMGYEKFMYNRWTPVKLLPCGLVASKASPIIRATPDARVVDFGCTDHFGIAKIAKIKCPYTKQHVTPPRCLHR